MSRDIKDLHKMLETIKANLAVAEAGRKKALEQLQEKYGVADEDEALDQANKITKEIKTIEAKREKLIQKAEEILKRYA